jgi:hypothetical protein
MWRDQGSLSMQCVTMVSAGKNEESLSVQCVAMGSAGKDEEVLECARCC